MVKSGRTLVFFGMLALVVSANRSQHVEAHETADAVKYTETAGLPLDVYREISDWLSRAEQQTLSIKDLRDRIKPHETALRLALKSTMVIQRALSARALAFATDTDAAQLSLKGALSADDDAGVRAMAAASLGMMNDAASVEALLAALNDVSPDVRQSAIVALGQIRDERAGMPLLRVLRYETQHAVRIAAARTLAVLPLENMAEQIAAVMDSETDERVKWVLAETLRLLKGAPEAVEEDDEFSPDGFSRKLKALAGDMKSVEEKLRGDRHDSSVQNDQQDVSIKLAEMIKSLEDMEKMKAKPAQESKEGKKRWGAMLASGSPTPSAKSAQSGKPSMPNYGTPSEQAAKVAEQRKRWAELPPASRDEMLQVFRPEVPERWRKRLEAYFLSVAAEEVKKK
jgi:HEAT repeat protein